MFKNFLMKKLLQSKLKGVPQDQQDKIFSAIEKNPDFFANIAKEVEEKTKAGMDQTSAMMEVMGRYQAELGALLK